MTKIISVCPVCGHEEELEHENKTCISCGRFFYVRKRIECGE